MKAEYIDHMGSDLSVVNAARVSFDKASDWVQTNEAGQEVRAGFDREGFPDMYDDQGLELSEPHLSKADQRLISFLARHNHWTPFAHTAITLRMTAPVPVRTQCFKHKAGFVENEQSRRYIITRPSLFVPETWRKKPEGSAKQGSGRDFGPWKQAILTRQYEEVCRQAIDLYIRWTEIDGMCPEQARFVLPQGVEVQWVWTGSLAAYARFYGQRTDPHAQKEILELARQVGEIIQPLFPISWEALTA
jgi:thymidylate synthase (FAD)